MTGHDSVVANSVDELGPDFPLASDHEFANAPAPEVVLPLRLAANHDLEAHDSKIHAALLQSPDALEADSTCPLYLANHHYDASVACDRGRTACLPMITSNSQR